MSVSQHPWCKLVFLLIGLLLQGFVSQFAAAEGLTTGSDGEGGLTVSSPAQLDLPQLPSRVATVDLTYDAIDVWDRIRRGFGMPDLNSDLVTEQQVFYLNRPAYLKRVFERGRRYLFHIVNELESRGMPTELALLPMVESAFNPMAYSRAHASGLWQFIPSTGKHFNLEQNWWVDERRDVVASTSAALDYLQTIYEMHGDWQLALASYNWGEGSVARAIEKNRAAGLPTEYAYLQMPAETRNYVPKLQALKNIVAQPELFNVSLPYVANRPYFATVESPAGLDLATAARLAETPLDEFVALNPGFKRPVIPAGTQPLVVPADKADVFAANFAAEADGAAKWRTYHVDATDTVERVAERFGLSAGQLREVNGLPAGTRLVEGQAVLVPVAGDPDGALAAARLLPDNALSSAASAAAPLIKKRVIVRDKHGRKKVIYKTVKPAGSKASSAAKSSGSRSAKGSGSSGRKSGSKAAPKTTSKAAAKPAVGKKKPKR
ncbi:MAG: transglycosylase SLT domain-containing protein [Zoogloeaceae bacterium]|nr:transglycosylase SLT domain-containing protein [Zoogloeaceae bacterium]MCP5238959.1 transglycosylase SLT domain-containing protein [Zoogloeaceae bacterium]MCP5254153.1 transglycosylase SLT domain-containing protein [Zoogloeaceae bacterium]MCP5295328.1 transglycosylase SLT domain-containing protein [Zoogloeaceae bacterium]MCW5613611.1 transglycosylase SLT domain-containing protein [Rhodocyclaceae bacterium]